MTWMRGGGGGGGGGGGVIVGESYCLLALVLERGTVEHVRVEKDRRDCSMSLSNLPSWNIGLALPTTARFQRAL